MLKEFALQDNYKDRIYPVPIRKGTAVEYAFGNLFIREMRFSFCGDIRFSHKHNFDHTTYCVQGSLSLKSDDADIIKILKAGQFVLIRAGVTHEVIALEDNTLAHCIFSHRDPEGRIIQTFDGNMDSYD